MSTPAPSGSIGEKLARFEGELEEALQRLGRQRRDITVVAVSKTHPTAAIRQAYEAGQKCFGENKVQEGMRKIPELPDDCEWHLVGHLQRNKTRDAVRNFALIHSVDSVRLANEIDLRSRQIDKVQPVLVQVNTTAESQKSGCEPDQIKELISYIESLPNILLQGLMTIGPFTDDEASIRHSFAMLHDLFEHCRNTGLTGTDFRHLSMGMTGDWPIALEYSATILRVGTAIFGERNYVA